ncbi:LamB/YcsF family protein [Thalassotalea sp. HSM 43]|uniref:5-oxoprolinase subunit PxpA n=1 Tax=Thalassotalea sp. HSM 43 TaxID=2552945 RepID=UPI0010813BBA|nr:5-oxoprolinase subunit PxpA [Thalassotalea sp. HSM 43]QBY03845.1 LamB/YcsF family protein [Thalassotalea sp. HSM 43]
MKVNCDLGEHANNEENPDAHIMPYIDMANIACGGHAGDAQTMADTIAMAKNEQVIIGAHPSYPDRANFGRVSLTLPKDALVNSLVEQIDALHSAATKQDAKVSYVKPHGALYNDMMKDSDIFSSVCAAVAKTNRQRTPQQKLMIQALVDNSEQRDIAKQYNIELIYEAFADRGLLSDGRLQSRQYDNALITDRIKVKKRVHQLIAHQEMTTVNSEIITIKADTLCLHGDNPNAADIVTTIRTVLEELNEDG